MSPIEFVILATLAWLWLTHGLWPWSKTWAWAPLGSGLGLFLLTCEILWLFFVSHRTLG